METPSSQSLFDYLTQPDRFDVAVQIYEAMPDIRLQLLQEFWLPVLDVIEAELVPEGWEMIKSDKIFDRYQGFFLRFPDWEGAHVGVSSIGLNAYFGITYADRSQTFDRAKMDQYMLEKNLKLKYKDAYWLAYRFYENMDFTRPAGCAPILPGNRDGVSRQYIAEFLAYCREMRPRLEVLNTFKRLKEA